MRGDVVLGEVALAAQFCPWAEKLTSFGSPNYRSADEHS
jgi:hypothetical protein